MRKVAILALTPYQLYNAVYLKDTLYCKDEVDLYVADYMPYMSALNTNISSIAIFENVCLLPILKLDELVWNRRNLFGKYFLRTLILLFKRHALPFLDKKYDIFMFSFESIAVWIAGTIYKKSQTLFLRFEDGLAEYAYEANQPIISKAKDLYFTILGIPKEIENVSCLPLYVHSVSLAQSYDFRKNIQIPICKDIYLLRQQLNRVFEWKENYRISNKVIYFGSDHLGDLQAEQLKICDEMKCVFHNEFIVKMHPKQTKDEYDSDSYSVYENLEIPWELHCLNDNMENKVLVSIISTACFTPYILFRQEPIVILLYKFIQCETWHIGKAMDEFIDRLRKCYRNPNRIIIPKDYNEFVNIINKLRKTYEL